MLLITSHSNYHFLIIQYMLKLNYHVIIFHVVKNEHDASFYQKKKKKQNMQRNDTDASHIAV